MLILFLKARVSVGRSRLHLRYINGQRQHKDGLVFEAIFPNYFVKEHDIFLSHVVRRCFAESNKTFSENIYFGFKHVPFVPFGTLGGKKSASGVDLLQPLQPRLGSYLRLWGLSERYSSRSLGDTLVSTSPLVVSIGRQFSVGTLLTDRGHVQWILVGALSQCH